MRGVVPTRALSFSQHQNIRTCLHTLRFPHFHLLLTSASHSSPSTFSHTSRYLALSYMYRHLPLPLQLYLKPFHYPVNLASHTLIYLPLSSTRPREESHLSCVVIQVTYCPALDALTTSTLFGMPPQMAILKLRVSCLLSAQI